jgi:hypothetical protein
MNGDWGGEALLQLPQPNFYHDMLNVLHLGNGTLPAFTMGGIILSVLCVRYQGISGRTKLAWTVAAVALLLAAGFISRHFWILSKISATPTWLFYVTAIAVAAYAFIYWLVEVKGQAPWFNIIKPAGTATLTVYLVPYVAYGLADVTGIALPGWFTHGFMSLANCICFAFAIIWVAWVLGHIHIKLKI